MLKRLMLLLCMFVMVAPFLLFPAETKSGFTYKYISFDDIAPKNIQLKQCWNAMGMDDQERVYIGWTSLRNDGREDFAVFRYDNASGERRFLGTFIDASTKAGNIEPGEAIPKGHTRMLFINGKMYMASQGFHDFKNKIDDLPKYRGSHLYAYDITNDKLEDLSAGLPHGVVTKNQGIVAMSYLPGKNLLVGLCHPHSDIVLFDINQNKVAGIVPGIPWRLGNPLSREIVVTKEGKIYTYRGTEDPAYRHQAHNMWVYDLETETMEMTDYKITGGFWNGQTPFRDGSRIYLNTVNGELYVLNAATGELDHLGHFLPAQDYQKRKRIAYLYGITLSQDEKSIYGITSPDNSNLYRYDIQTKQVSVVDKLRNGCYTGSDMRDSKGNIYFASFNAWEGNCRLLVVNTVL